MSTFYITAYLHVTTKIPSRPEKDKKVSESKIHQAKSFKYFISLLLCQNHIMSHFINNAKCIKIEWNLKSKDYFYLNGILSTKS